MAATDKTCNDEQQSYHLVYLYTSTSSTTTLLSPFTGFGDRHYLCTYYYYYYNSGSTLSFVVCTIVPERLSFIREKQLYLQRKSTVTGEVTNPEFAAVRALL